MIYKEAGGYYLDEKGRLRPLGEKGMVRKVELKRDGRIKWAVLRKCKGGKGVCR